MKTDCPAARHPRLRRLRACPLRYHDQYLVAAAVEARLADLDDLTDDERATITAVIGAITTKAKLRLLTGGAS